MEDVSPFVTHLARLTWLLANQPDDQDGQKEELRNALTNLSSKSQGVVLRELSLAVASVHDMKDEAAVNLRELAFRMAGHSVRQLQFEVGVPAREVFEIAQALASSPMHGDEGAAFDDQVVRLHLTSVTAVLGGSGFVRHATPIAMPAYSGSARSRTPAAAFEVEQLAGLNHAEPLGTLGSEALPPAGNGGGESQVMMQGSLMPALGRDATVDAILERLDQAVDSAVVRDMVEDVARLTEDLGGRSRWVDVATVMFRMHEHHERQHEGDVKRAFMIGIRRLQRPAILQGVASLIPGNRELRDNCVHILSHAGDAGADVLIEKLIGSEVSGERRLYVEALRHSPAAVKSLLHLLTDERWYVVRNAASLIGELRAVEADKRLIELLSHRESRVRQAAAGALGKLATSRALLALLQCLNDASSDVRLQAVWGIGSAKNPRAVPWIIEALDKEEDADVQGALLAALGATPTDDGVARLIRAADAGGLLVRKPTALRLRAIEALGEAGTPSARQALQKLANDRDREVRAAVEQAAGKLSA